MVPHIHLHKAAEDAKREADNIRADSTYEELQIAVWRIQYLYGLVLKIQKELKDAKKTSSMAARQRDRYEVS